MRVRKGKWPPLKVDCASGGRGEEKGVLNLRNIKNYRDMQIADVE